ncbi:hypothetical protein JOC69_001649 [Heliobacterium gestii]|nr:hypothetical protein [Heliomicrobium gestii]
MRRKLLWVAGGIGYLMLLYGAVNFLLWWMLADV